MLVLNLVTGSMFQQEEVLMSNVTDQTLVHELVPDYLKCAANDCQDANTTSKNLELYTPDKSTLIVLLISLAVFSLSGCILHVFLVPNINIKGKCSFSLLLFEILFYRRA